MADFIGLRNFILAISALLGVILFVVTMMRWIGTVNESGSKKYSTGQLLLMMFISIVMVSAVTYMNMGSYTLFGSNSYTVVAQDPWLIQSNISSILAQLGTNTKDIDHFSKIVTYFFIAIKSFGLGLFIVTLSKWYRLASGENTCSGSMIAIYFILSWSFWNYGIVLKMISYSLGYEIQI